MRSWCRTGDAPGPHQADDVPEHGRVVRQRVDVEAPEVRADVDPIAAHDRRGVDRLVHSYKERTLLQVVQAWDPDQGNRKASHWRAN